ncbi:hypothetical protein MNV49_005492 [Pseudohyphozyma bogoriensis]|nr:hypothetical protein MNV49_005492 [Pseudohyphozyma bogoriensis]
MQTIVDQIFDGLPNCQSPRTRPTLEFLAAHFKHHFPEIVLPQGTHGGCMKGREDENGKVYMSEDLVRDLETIENKQKAGAARSAWYLSAAVFGVLLILQLLDDYVNVVFHRNNTPSAIGPTTLSPDLSEARHALAECLFGGLLVLTYEKDERGEPSSVKRLELKIAGFDVKWALRMLDVLQGQKPAPLPSILDAGSTFPISPYHDSSFKRWILNDESDDDDEYLVTFDESGLGIEAMRDENTCLVPAMSSAELIYSPLSDIKPTFNSLRTTFYSGKTLPLDYRKKQLHQLGLLLEENQDDFVKALQSDLSKPSLETITGELGPTKAEVVDAINNLDKWSRDEKVKTGAAWAMAGAKVKKCPKGIALIIGTWNFPISLLLGPLVGAIAAGCTAILKPPEQSPAFASLLTVLLPKYLDTQAYAIINGSTEVAQTLLQEPFDHVFYTGSGKVGKIIARAVLENGSGSVTLELGGKSPALVLNDCDVKVTAKRLMWGKWTNAGQVCLAPDYVLCTPTLRPKLIAEFQAVLKEFAHYPSVASGTPLSSKSKAKAGTSLPLWFGGSSSKPPADVAGDVASPHPEVRAGGSEERETKQEREGEQGSKEKELYISHKGEKGEGGDSRYAKLVSSQAFERITSLLRDTRGEVVVRGEIDESAQRVGVTVVDLGEGTGEGKDDVLLHDEIFGPILPVLTLNTKEEMVQFVRERSVGTPLALYVFSESKKDVDWIFDHTRSGTFLHNDVLVQFLIPGLPFGGVGESGKGRYHGIYSYKEFSHERPMACIPTWSLMESALQPRYPPYTQSNLKRMLLLTGVTIRRSPSTIVRLFRTLKLVLGVLAIVAVWRKKETIRDAIGRAVGRANEGRVRGLVGRVVELGP